MKIAYCISGTFNSGGMERIVIAKANWLANHGFETYIITVEQKGRQPFYHIDKRVGLIDLGINYWDYKNAGVWKKIFAIPLKKRLHKRRLSNVIKDVCPDIIISTFEHEFDFLYKIKGNAIAISEIHFQKNYMIAAKRRGILRLVDYLRIYMRNRKIQKYDKFVILTQEDYESWPRKRNIEVIPNFASVPDHISDQNGKRAIAVGRLSYQKNFQALIRMWDIVCQHNDDWILDIYGNGSDKDVLQRLIEKLNLESRVIIHPATPSIENAYLKASIFLLTSRYEGFPLVLNEAMSYGLAPISFACKCGPRDIIENNISGLLIENEDLESMAYKVLELINDDEKRKQIGINAYNRIKSEFSEDAVMHKWTRLFGELTKLFT